MRIVIEERESQFSIIFALASQYCSHSVLLTFRHRASSIQDRRFAALQRTLFIQSVTGGMCETSGECSLGQTIPI